MIKRAFSMLWLLLLRMSGVVLQLLIQVLVGRLLGPAGLGTLQLFTTWTCVLGEGIATGRPAHSMKTLAVVHDRSTAGQIRAYVVRQIFWISSHWLLLLVLLLPALQFLSEQSDVLLLACCASLCFALCRLFSDGLKGTGNTVVSIGIENVGPPAVVLVGCGALYLCDQPITLWSFVAATAAGFCLSMFSLGFFLWRRLRSCRGADASPLSAKRRELLPLWGTGLLSILFLQFPFLVMPLYATTTELGQFAAAFKVVNLVSTILILMASLYGPRFARAWAAGDLAATRAVLWESQLLAVALFLPQVLLLATFVEPLLAFFGDGFQGAAPFIWILLAGQLVNAATGLPGLMLNMAGAGRLEFLCLMSTVALAGVAALFVGPHYGALGVAVVYSCALAVKNLASLVLARRLTDNSVAAMTREVLS